MADKSKTTFDYWREAAPELVAYGIRMGWIHLPPDASKAARAKRLLTQRECMKSLRCKDKKTKTKENHNGSN